jgi:type III pantothenate kinase
MNLVVDIGNTTTKVALFNQQHLDEKQTFTNDLALKEFLTKCQADAVLISTVRSHAHEVSDWCHHIKQKFVLTHQLPLPIKIMYATPLTLGVDRIAGACGAQTLFPHRNVLVIDAGTCITYDFTNAQGSYLGGGISPGLYMRLNALHTFTAKLPLVKPTIKPELVGNTTETSIQSGVVNGTTAEIDGIISAYQQKYPDLQVILCGGDTSFFENRLKASIFASPDLVLFGLNSVLIHNVGI